MKSVRAKGLSLTVQHMHLKRLHSTGVGNVHRDLLTWRQRIRPHPLAHEYLCKLEYSLGWFPRMYVENPPLLALAAGRKLPHVRSKEEPIAMCLFIHDEACFNANMLLGEIVIPMAYFWLASFEEWLFTGIWRGGGTHEIPIVPPQVAPVFPNDLGLLNVA